MAVTIARHHNVREAGVDGDPEILMMLLDVKYKRELGEEITILELTKY